MISSTSSPVLDLITRHRSINASNVIDILSSVRSGFERHPEGTSGGGSSLQHHDRSGNASAIVTRTPRDHILPTLDDGPLDEATTPSQEVVFMSSFPSTSFSTASNSSGDVISSLLPLFTSSESSSNMSYTSSTTTLSASSSAPPNLSLYSCLEYLAPPSPSASSSSAAYLSFSPPPNASHVWCNTTTSGLGRSDLLGAGQEVILEEGDETFLFDRGDVRGVLIALYTLVFISGFVGE